MIVVFYGQPSSGKTTLAKLLQETIFLQNQPTPVIIDGDEIRSIFKDTDYSKDGRLKNLKRINFYKL
jgi:adenylylsulfate kinase-like enzyme